MDFIQEVQVKSTGFEAEYGGFCTTFSRSPDRFRLTELTAGLGSTWQTMGVALKFYSCVGSNHTTLDALREMQRQHRFTAADVERIVVHGSQVTADHVGWKYEPAGMTSSGWPQRDDPAARVATGYTNESEDGPSQTRRNNIYTAPARGSSAGGGYATAPDLVKFAAALQSGKLLTRDDADRLFGGGLGVAGGAPGINADLEMDAQSGYVLVVLSNYDPPSARDVAKTIRGWIGLSG